MHCVPVFTKHFADRVMQRCSSMDTLHQLKRKIRRHFCECVFDCLLGETRHHRIEHKNAVAVLYFCETTKKLYVKPYYEKPL